MTPSDQAPADSLKAVYCRRFQCAPERFEASVLRRCFPWQVRFLGSLVLLVSPGTFKREFAMIARLGTTTTDATVKGELEGYAYENQRDRSFRVRTLGLRLSRRLFIRMLGDLRARGVQAGRGRDEDRKSASGHAAPKRDEELGPRIETEGEAKAEMVRNER